MDEFEVEIVAAFAPGDAGGESLVQITTYRISAESRAEAEREAVERHIGDGIRPRLMFLLAETVGRVRLPAALAA